MTQWRGRTCAMVLVDVGCGMHQHRADGSGHVIFLSVAQLVTLRRGTHKCTCIRLCNSLHRRDHDGQIGPMLVWKLNPDCQAGVR